MNPDKSNKSQLQLNPLGLCVLVILHLQHFTFVHFAKIKQIRKAFVLREFSLKIKRKLSRVEMNPK